MEYNTPTAIIAKVGRYLGKALPDDREALIKHIKGLEALRFELAEAVAEQHKLVAEMKQRMLHPKDKDYTELDRNVMLDAHISVIRKDYEFLVEIQTIIRDRIDLAKLLLDIESKTT